MSEIKKENLKLAVLALREDINLTEEELADAINKKLNPVKSPIEELRVIRRTELPSILSLSLREVDRLITPLKINGRLIFPPALPTVKLSKRAIGVREKDLVEYLDKCKRNY